MISIVKTSARFLWLSLQQMPRQSSAPCFIAMVNYQPVDIKSRWRHNWKSAQVDNSHLVCDPTIWQPGFNLPRQQWSLLNRFHIEQGHCGACRRKWRLTDTDLCPCDETQTMSHTVESCPDKTEWRLISATLCGWRCCFVADQLWLMTRIREEEDYQRSKAQRYQNSQAVTRPSVNQWHWCYCQRSIKCRDSALATDWSVPET